MTATAHIDIRPLSSDETDAVSGAGFRPVFKTTLVMQVIPTDPARRRGDVTDSRDRYA